MTEMVRLEEDEDLLDGIAPISVPSTDISDAGLKPRMGTEGPEDAAGSGCSRSTWNTVARSGSRAHLPLKSSKPT
jgi:hypothetical protein